MSIHAADRARSATLCSLEEAGDQRHVPIVTWQSDRPARSGLGSSALTLGDPLAQGITTQLISHRAIVGSSPIRWGVTRGGDVLDVGVEVPDDQKRQPLIDFEDLDVVQRYGVCRRTHHY